MENTKKPIDFLPDFSQDYVGELLQWAGVSPAGTMIVLMGTFHAESRRAFYENSGGVTS